MKLTVLLILLGLLRVSATSNAQVYRINLDYENVSCGKVIESIKGQTNLDFFFSNKELNVNRKVSVSCKDASLEEALKQILGDGYSFRLVDNTVVIRPVKQRIPQPKQVTVKGIVKDTKGTPLPGVTVLLKGTSLGVSTDIDGKFTLSFPEVKEPAFIFSFIGMKTTEVKYTGQPELKVVMKEDATEMDEVVVTGIFTRKAESFTGSTATYKTEDLKMMGSGNILQSLRTLDPSFHITPNNEFGSDPNKLPDIDIRGKTSVVNLKEEYETDPNQPLFILDGFEVSLQTIVDLNMDRVESATILKDAASTAIYGSKAANGVLVIETKKPEAGQLRVSYNGDLQVTMPDLSDYNMMNAAEKLEFERRAGVYSSGTAIKQYSLYQIYSQILNNVQSGVDSYWLSEPVRTGIVHKHNLYVDGGDKVMRYGIGVNYNGTQGVMKKSNRDVLGFNIDLMYRKGKFSFNNKFSLTYTDANNPPQAFSVYVQTNPYFPKDYEGEVPRYLGDFKVDWGGAYSTMRYANPLYNNSLNHIDETKTLGFRNNFQVEWRVVDELRARGRISVSKNNSSTENFVSPYHTSFDNTTKTERGSYTKRSSDNWEYNGDVTVTYGKLFAENHLVNLVAGWNFQSNKQISDGYKVVGFPDDEIPNPAFSNKYPESSKASYSESTKRSTSFYVNANYSLKNRYLLDFNYRLDGSSVFGVDKRFSDAWSVGVAWNLHNEYFIGDWANLLKIRASVGKLGNQNFSSYNSSNTYVYNTDLQNMFGMGAGISTFGNSNLEWQRTMDYNLGASLTILGNKLKIDGNVYKRVTDPMVVSILIPSSVGTTSYLTNFGASKTDGVEMTVAVSPILRPHDRINWTITLNGRHQSQVYDKIGNRLDQLNEELKKTSLQRYRDGASPSDLWAVRSAGIDPMTGQEIFIKKDGTFTFDYDNKDEVVIGNSEPTLEGTFGTNLYYKGFSFSAHFRYRLGAENFNNELYNRIENIDYGQQYQYNQDKRALYDRWKEPGDIAQYRSISSYTDSDQGKYPMTSRYLQKENTLSGESISASYEFRDRLWLKKAGLSTLTLRTNINEIFRCSTVRAERGISYPFARTISFSMNVTF